MFNFATTVLKSLFSTPATRVKAREPFKRARGHISVDINNCIFCGICSKQCPVGAIKVDREAKTWEIDPFKCIICEYCTEKCPKKCLTSHEEYTKPSDKKCPNKSVRQEITGS